MLNYLPLQRLSVIDLGHCFALLPSTILSLLTLQQNVTTLQVLRGIFPLAATVAMIDKVLDRIKEFHSLTALDLTGISVKEARYSFLAEGGELQFPQLRELGAFSPEILERVGSRLEKVAIRTSNDKTERSLLLAAFTVGKEALRELTIYGNVPHIKRYILRPLLPSNLRALIILGWVVDYRTLPFMVKNLPQLKYLELSGKAMHGKRKVIRSNSLKVLSIDGYGGTGSLFIRCPKLKTLIVTSSSSFFEKLR